MRKIYLAPTFVKAQSLSAITAAAPLPVSSGYVPLS